MGTQRRIWSALVLALVLGLAWFLSADSRKGARSSATPGFASEPSAARELELEATPAGREPLAPSVRPAHEPPSTDERVLARIARCTVFTPQPPSTPEVAQAIRACLADVDLAALEPA